MPDNQTAKAGIKLPLTTPFLPPATGFVEQTARAMGLDKAGAMAVTLAVEEVFAYLADASGPGHEVAIDCLWRGYYLGIEFHFSAERLNLRAFNLTSRVDPTDEASLAELGLLIASRQVDRFQLKPGRDMDVVLSLARDKAYPEPEGSPPETAPLSGPVKIAPARPEDLKLLARLLRRDYDPVYYPSRLGLPGKLVDMVAWGDYRAAVALGPKGELAGGIVWQSPSVRAVEMFGPFIFDQSAQGAAEGLIEAVLTDAARSPALGVYNRLPTTDRPLKHFDPLGTYLLGRPGGSRLEVTTHYRQTAEDPGATAWAHPDQLDFLQGEYRRLVLPREVRTVTDDGESRDENAVLAADLSFTRGLAGLKPVRPGYDAVELVADHVRLIRHHGLRDIFFEQDTGQAWQASFVPALLQAGFTPRLVVPFAADSGDLVAWQWSEGQ